jgi:glycosyltransferase involved in cell wall biosynthesis
MSLYIDLSEFLGNPIATGIQRIPGEMCKCLPPNSMIPVRLHAGRCLALPQALIDLLRTHFRDAGHTAVEELRRLGAVERGGEIRMSEGDTLLVPEVFDNLQRLKYFLEMPMPELARCRFIVYDLLPLTHPQYFAPGAIVGVSQYYRVLRAASCCGFISEDTRSDYYSRLKRISARGGVVLPLGCDSLGPRAESAAPNRPPTFSVLGTIEPRKNHQLILEAFEPLLRQIDGLRLSFIGQLGWVDSEFAQRLRALTADKSSGFEFHSVSGDDAIRNCIEQSRATIYVSAAEGYGLPPVESLWLGTPVIASTTIPSLKRLGPAGVHFVEPLNAVNLRRAVLAFMDDAYAKRKAQETLDLNLPTWRSFTEEVLRWCGQEPLLA